MDPPLYFLMGGFVGHYQPFVKINQLSRI